MKGNEIRLKFDDHTIIHLRNNEQSLMFRIFYWASYLGQNDIVEKIIRMGYSPFVKSFDQKNALMAAILSGNSETVKKMLEFRYIPSNITEFEKSKNITDDRGNNARHMAYKLMHKEIE